MAAQLYVVNAQLVGSRGVVKLPPGFVYHDEDTLPASRRVAIYAKKYQEKDNHKADENKLISLQRNDLGMRKKPQFATFINKIGHPLALENVVGFEDSRLFITPVENRMNVPLEEIEEERRNGQIRLLPGEGTIPAQKYAPKTKNRFDQEVKEESERSKNAGETIFDDGPNETKLKYQYKGHPITGEYYDKYFGNNRDTKSMVENAKNYQKEVKTTYSTLNSFEIPTIINNGGNFHVVITHPFYPLNFPFVSYQ